MSIRKHPYIVCHMMSSIDGKIASGENTDILDGYYDLYTQTEDAYQFNAWMCGRVTMAMFASKEKIDLLKDKTEVEIIDYINKPSSKYYLFGVDTKGLLRWDKNTVKFGNIIDELNLVIVVTANTPQEYLNYLKNKGISYVFAGDNELDFEILFSKLKDKFGVNNLLLEGGGLINGSVLAAGFIDEISLLITPTVVNKTKAPSVFERKVEETLSITSFKLKDFQRQDKDCIWLKYVRIRAGDQS